jgi:uncharacterized protein
MVQKGRKNPQRINSRIQARLNRIVKILASNEIYYKQLILFGSQARGEARPDSDVDICIVVDDGVKDPIEIQRSATKWVALAGIAADFFATSAKQFKTDMVSPLLHEVRKDGIVIS